MMSYDESMKRLKAYSRERARNMGEEVDGMKNGKSRAERIQFMINIINQRCFGCGNDSNEKILVPLCKRCKEFAQNADDDIVAAFVYRIICEGYRYKKEGEHMLRHDMRKWLQDKENRKNLLAYAL